MAVVARNEDEAHRLADDPAAWLPTGSVRVHRSAPRCCWSARCPRRRVGRSIAGAGLAGVKAAERRAGRAAGGAGAAHADRRALGALRVEVRVGQRIGQTTLLGSLVAAGYDIAVEVSGRRRVRIARRHRRRLAARAGSARLFGDEIELIRGFDPVTRLRGRLEEVTKLPAGEFLPSMAGPRCRNGRRATDRAAAGGPGAPGTGRSGRGGGDLDRAACWRHTAITLPAARPGAD